MSSAVLAVSLAMSATALMEIVLTSVSLSGPGVPVLPPSLVNIVNVTIPLKSAAGTKTGAPAPLKYVLISANDPDRPKVEEPLVVTATPPPATAVKVPLPLTDSVTLMMPLPASTSATEIPERTSCTSSLVVKSTGNVLMGASLTGVTLIETVTVLPSTVPSLTL